MKGEHWHLPHKKPKGDLLTRWQKTFNKRFAKERIVVEHGIRGMKIFRKIGEVITSKSDELFSTILLAVANLSNFRGWYGRDWGRNPPDTAVFGIHKSNCAYRSNI